jgi:hypothetical protein
MHFMVACGIHGSRMPALTISAPNPAGIPTQTVSDQGFQAR